MFTLWNKNELQFLPPQKQSKPFHTSSHFTHFRLQHQSNAYSTQHLEAQLRSTMLMLFALLCNQVDMCAWRSTSFCITKTPMSLHEQITCYENVVVSVTMSQDFVQKQPIFIKPVHSVISATANKYAWTAHHEPIWAQKQFPHVTNSHVTCTCFLVCDTFVICSIITVGKFGSLTVASGHQAWVVHGANKIFTKLFNRFHIGNKQWLKLIESWPVHLHAFDQKSGTDWCTLKASQRNFVCDVVVNGTKTKKNTDLTQMLSLTLLVWLHAPANTNSDCFIMEVKHSFWDRKLLTFPPNRVINFWTHVFAMLQKSKLRGVRFGNPLVLS